MSLFTDLLERLRVLVHRDRDEQELDEELRFHLDRDIAERLRQGADPAAARRAALAALGGLEQRKEEVRDARGVRPLEELGADIRYALRGLRRNPGFTSTAIFVLALGLGATTAVFSVMDSVVFAPLPYPDPDRLVLVTESNGQGRWALSTADVTGIREHQRSFVAWGELQPGDAALAGTGSAERIRIGRASAGYFAAVGVPVARGRAVQKSDEDPAAPEVVVLTDALAVRLFDDADRAIGRNLTLDGVPHTVVGVLPPGRNELGGWRAGAWPALKLAAPVRRGPFWLRGLGRLESGVTMEAAARDLASISARILPLWPDFRDSTARLSPMPLREALVGRANTQVSLFGAAVLLVLLLAITNVTTLALVRASARQPEIAVRTMLGARRSRLARLLMTENLVLTLVAGVLGLVVAYAGVKLAIARMPDLPRIDQAALDWRAVTVGIVASIVAGILVSLSPLAALASRSRGSLHTDTQRAGTGVRTNRIRAILVVTEFALALPLLVGAGLLLNSFVRMQGVDPGFEPEGLVAAGVSLPSARYPEPQDLQRFWTRATQRIAELEGVTGGGLASEIPPDNSGSTDNFNLVDHPVPEGTAEPSVPWYYVSSGYFSAVGIPLLAGRLFTETDTGGTYPVVIVSRSWARRYLPDRDPIGRQLVQGGCYDCPRTTIIGVVEDIRNLGAVGETDAVYGPFGQSNARSMNLVVRARGSTATVQRDLRNLLRGLDPELPLDEATVSQRFSDALADPRRWAVVLSAFAAAGVALSALGVFGLMSYVVRQRRREIGVRLALGARPMEITRLVIVRGMRYAAIGSVIGLAVTFVFAKRLRGLLFEVSPTDAATIGVVAMVLLGFALIACWLPGRRAARIRPIEAIGSE